MTDPIKLSNERVREILRYALDRHPNREAVAFMPEDDEIAALAQNVLDLRTATMALEDANKDLVHDAMKLVTTIETLRAALRGES